MMKKLKFNKENKKWYIDLPQWTGRKSALQMVSGADTLLDYLSDGKDNVELYISENKQEGFSYMKLIEKCIFNGAYYKVEGHNDNQVNIMIWLCNVTKYVFGYFPKKIYFTKAE